VFPRKQHPPLEERHAPVPVTSGSTSHWHYRIGIYSLASDHAKSVLALYQYGNQFIKKIFLIHRNRFPKSKRLHVL